MADTWDDDEDEWDVDNDDELDARLGLKKATLQHDDEEEEDLALKEKAASEKAQTQELKKKGQALAQKKKAEEDRREEEKLARKAMEVEAELKANMTAEQLRAYERQQQEEADHALTNDLFGGAAAAASAKGGGASGSGSGDVLVLKDLKDHLKHAHKIAACVKAHGKISLATALIKEIVQECKDVLDDAAITDIIKVCNTVKNEKLAALKKKSKGQAQKPQKRDKVAELKAKQLEVELFGDNNKYDRYDEMGERYEDDFF